MPAYSGAVTLEALCLSFALIECFEHILELIVPDRGPYLVPSLAMPLFACVQCDSDSGVESCGRK